MNTDMAEVARKSILGRISRHARHLKQSKFKITAEGLFAEEDGVRKLVAPRSDMIYQVESSTGLSKVKAEELFDSLVEGHLGRVNIDFINFEIKESDPKEK